MKRAFSWGLSYFTSSYLTGSAAQEIRPRMGCLASAGTNHRWDKMTAMLSSRPARLLLAKSCIYGFGEISSDATDWPIGVNGSLVSLALSGSTALFVSAEANQRPRSGWRDGAPTENSCVRHNDHVNCVAGERVAGLGIEGRLPTHGQLVIMMGRSARLLPISH